MEVGRHALSDCGLRIDESLTAEVVSVEVQVRQIHQLANLRRNRTCRTEQRLTHMTLYSSTRKLQQACKRSRGNGIPALVVTTSKCMQGRFSVASWQA